MTSGPPPIPGVRRYFVEARGVRLHVTESGPEDGRPVLALHGWPQHRWAYNDLLADPPPGLRIFAPDLPGFGWSGLGRLSDGLAGPRSFQRATSP